MLILAALDGIKGNDGRHSPYLRMDGRGGGDSQPEVGGKELRLRGQVVLEELSDCDSNGTMPEPVSEKGGRVVRGPAAATGVLSGAAMLLLVLLLLLLLTRLLSLPIGEEKEPPPNLLINVAQRELPNHGEALEHNLFGCVGLLLIKGRG